MADGELQRLGRDPGGPDDQRRAAHAECRAVGHAWDDVALHGLAGFYALDPEVKQRGLSLHLKAKLLSWQRPRDCSRCGASEQRWGPWLARCAEGPLPAHVFAQLPSSLCHTWALDTASSVRLRSCCWCGRLAHGGGTLLASEASLGRYQRWRRQLPPPQG